LTASGARSKMAPTHLPRTEIVMSELLATDAGPQSNLPNRLRLLCVSDEEPSWTALALLLSRHGCHEPHFRWCDSDAQVLSVLRDETFDCIVICQAREADEALPGKSLLQAVETAGHAEPVLIVVPSVSDAWLKQMSGEGCEILVTPAGWRCAALPDWIARTIHRAEVVRENARLADADRRRTDRERDESEQLLDQQRRILRAGLTTCEDDDDDRLPEQVDEFYQDLLRTYVMMGSGNLSEEIRRLCEIFAVADVSPRTLLRIHLQRVENLIRGLGKRSSRHILVRADVLAMELMIQLGEFYRRKSHQRGLGGFGIDLLHEESLRQKHAGR